MATSNKVTFQVISDLHLESKYEYDYTIPPKSPYLILAGDTGSCMPEHQARFAAWLTHQCTLFTDVFLVLGNNEPKYTSIAENTTFLRSLAQKINSSPGHSHGYLTPLHQTAFALPHTNITLLGCPL